MHTGFNGTRWIRQQSAFLSPSPRPSRLLRRDRCRDALRADIQKKVHAQEADYEKQMREIRDDKRNPVFRALDRLMKKAGIDILE